MQQDVSKMNDVCGDGSILRVRVACHVWISHNGVVEMSILTVRRTILVDEIILFVWVTLFEKSVVILLLCCLKLFCTLFYVLLETLFNCRCQGFSRPCVRVSIISLARSVSRTETLYYGVDSGLVSHGLVEVFHRIWIWRENCRWPVIVTWETLAIPRFVTFICYWNTEEMRKVRKVKIHFKIWQITKSDAF